MFAATATICDEDQGLDRGNRVHLASLGQLTRNIRARRSKANNGESTFRELNGQISAHTDVYQKKRLARRKNELVADGRG